MMDSSKVLVASDGDIKCFVKKCGHIDTNAGFIENTKLNQAIMIDAPFGSHAASKEIFSPDTSVVSVFFTHGHWDHIGDAHIFKELGAKLHSHGLDRFWIENPDLMTMFVGIADRFMSCEVDIEVKDGDIVNVNGWLDLKCRWVPGHAAGDLTIYIENLKCVFTGDTLFQGCIGRSDLPGGNEALLISGIKEKILTLPDDTIVIPGHGRFSTVIEEKNNNEYLCA